MSKRAARRKTNGQERTSTRPTADKQTSPLPPAPPAPAQPITHEEITIRAYAFFVSRGRTHGADQADWFRAEAELRRERGIEESHPSLRAGR